MKWNPFNTKIGLALGGGAARGIAHIGVLKAFEEEQINVHCISGTSIGALVASYYAFGKPLDQIMAVGSALNLSKIANFTMQRGGLFSSDAIKDMIHRDLGEKRIEQANIPLAICTTDIQTGEQVIFTEGPLADAICASMAVPGLFVPVEVGGRILVDGGLVENVPISPLEKMGAGITIGVDLSHAHSYPIPNSTVDVINNSIDICMDLSTKHQLKNADVVVALDLRHYSRTDNAGRTKELLMEGYRPTKQKIRSIKRYRRTNILHFLMKVIREVAPVKIPELIQRRYKILRQKFFNPS